MGGSPGKRRNRRERKIGDAKAEVGSDWWRKEGARMLNGKRMP